MPDPSSPAIVLSVVVLVWDELELTRRCVESIRAHTDVGYELIVVDNGSAPDAAAYVADAADISVRHESNAGFAAGMNAGLEVANGRFVAFVNNDTELPASWASTLLDAFDRIPDAGIVLPAVTAAGNEYSIRDAPGDRIIRIPPFTEIPSGVVYVMPPSPGPGGRRLGGGLRGCQQRGPGSPLHRVGQ